MASITLKSVSKSFGAKDVIRNIDIAVSDGEFLVLLGLRAVENRRFCACWPVLKAFPAEKY